MCKVLKKFTEANARKSAVNFAFSGYADFIKYQENLRFYVRARRLLTLVPPARARGHKTKGRFTQYNFVACDMLTTSLRHESFRVNQTYNLLAIVVHDTKNVAGF